MNAAGGGLKLWNSHNKINAKGGRRCRVCKNPGAMVRKYHINMCRQCFREMANDIGFHKYR